MNKISMPVSQSSGNPFSVPKSSAIHSSTETSLDNQNSSTSLKVQRHGSETSEKENETKSEPSRSLTGSQLPLYKTALNVGFSQLPKQLYRKTNRRGFTFNVIVAGITGLGKTTFLNALFMSDIYDDKHPVRNY